MFTNSDLDNLERYNVRIIKSGEYEGRVESESEITPQQYAYEFAGYMYRKMRGVKGIRIRTHYKYEFGCEVITLVTESNGYRIRYTFHTAD